MSKIHSARRLVKSLRGLLWDLVELLLPVSILIAALKLLSDSGCGP